MLRLKICVALVLTCVCAFAQTPSVTEGGIVDAASFRGGGVTAGSLISIFGSELAAALQQASSIPLSTSLGGVSVTVNSVPAPLLFVAAGQINAQLPWNVLGSGTTGTGTVVVTRGGVSSTPRTVPIAPFSPGIFALSGGLAVAVNADDGSLAQRTGAVEGVNCRPARIGGAIILYANGLGAVDGAVPNGAASGADLRRTTTAPTVLIGGREGQVLFSGLAPQFVGVNQLNVVIPEGVAAGNSVPIQIRIGGVTSAEGLIIAVGN
ncbi:MAG: hypothetical protein ACRD8O_05195 [Bryobacteraceae bacterium]